jgi:hypothetical protein
VALRFAIAHRVIAVAPDKTDPKAEVLRRYATVRKIAPAFLEAFTFSTGEMTSTPPVRSTPSSSL